jgi:hypothetical protein
MGEAIAFVVFGLIGIAILGVVVYIGGMLLSGPVIAVDETIKEIHHLREEHAHKQPAPRHSGRMALHH